MSVRDFGGVLALMLLSVVLPAQAGLVFSADLEASKTGPAIAAADSDVAYDISVTNLSADPASNVTLSDSIPAGMSFVSATQNSGTPFSCSTPAVGDTIGTVSCSVVSLAGNASASFTVVFHIAPATPPSTFFTNIATVSSALDENEENNSAVAVTSTPSAPMADLSVDKTGPAVTAADADIVYTITLSNGGPNASTGATWSDTLPGNLTFVGLNQNTGPGFSCSTPAVGTGGTVQCTLASFPPGSASFTLTAHVPAGTPGGTTYSNTVTSSADNDPNNENDSGTIGTTVSEADVSVTKSAPANVSAGQNISYVLTLSNAGPDAALAVTLDDSLPAPLTFVSLTQNNGPAMSCVMPPVGSPGAINCSAAAFPSAASAQFTLIANVPDTYTGPALTNTATAAHESFDSNSANNSAQASTTVTPLPVDLTVTKSGPATVVGGQNATYTLSLNNVGGTTVANATLTDTLPATTGFVSFAQNSGPAFSCTTPAVGANGPVNCSLAVLPVGASASFTLVLSVPPGAADGAMLTNTAVAGSSGPDSNVGDNTASTTATVTNQADLSIIKSGPGNVTAGANLTYLLTLANAGPSTAQNVQLSDALPSGTTFQSLQQTSGPAASCTTPAVGAGGTVTCSLASFASGASAGFTLTVVTPAGAVNGSNLTNTATASASTADPNGANNSSTTVTTVTNQADLALTKTGPANVVAGSTASYTLTLAYNGAAAPAANVQLNDPLPSGATFASLTQNTGPAFTCTTPAIGATGSVSCSIASLPNAAPATFTLVINVPAGLVNGSVLTNTASSSTISADATAPNNSASTTATVSNVVDLNLSKSGPASLVVGQNASYTLTLANAGTSPALNVQLSDPMPTGTRFVSMTQTAGPAFVCTSPAVGGNGTVTCTAPIFAGGANATFALVLGTAGIVPGTLMNTAAVSSSSSEVGQANNAASAGTTLLADASLTFRLIPTLSTPWLILLVGALATVALFASSRRARRHG